VLDRLRLRNPELRRVLLYGASTALAAALTLLLTRVLWRALAPDVFGLWALIDPVLVPAAALTLFGVDHAIIKQLQIDRTPLAEVVGTLLAAALPPAAFCLIILGLAFDRLAHFPWADALMLSIAGEALIILMQTAFRAAGSVCSFAALIVLRNLLYLGVLLLVLAGASDHLSLGVVFLIRGGCVLGLAVAALALLRPRLPAKGIRFIRDRYADALRYGFPLLLTILLASIADVADRWFLAEFRGLRVVGVYAIHLKVAAILSQAIVIPFGLWFPRERFLRFDAPDGGRRFFVRTAVALAVLCTYLSGCVWLARDMLLPLLAPGVQASPAVLALCVGSVTCLALSQALNVGLLMPGHTTKNATADAIALTAGLLAAAALVPLYGPYGASASRFTTGFTLMVISAVWSRRVFSVPFPFGSIALYAGFSIFAAFIIDWALPPSGPAALAICLLAWTVTILLLAAFLLRGPILPDTRRPASDLMAMQLPKLP
jgi:O-antigen/teichoic acid export membrane protein